MGNIDNTLRLSNRERMIRTCLNQDIDRQPYWFMFGPWVETMERWLGEGLQNEDWQAHFKMDTGFVRLPVRLGYSPAFERKVLEAGERTSIIIDEQGITQEIMNSGSTIPRYINYPVTDRDSWEILKKRLNPDDPARFPEDWAQQIEALKASDAAIQVGEFPYGLFGTLRDMMGVEELLVMFYDDPDLIHEMMDTLTDMWLTIYEKILKDIQIDHIHIWEDMSGKQGPLISPAMFREFMTPNYRRIVAFAKEHGISVISVDTDGNMDLMMELFREAGINLVLPFEVQAGCDIMRYKKEYPAISIHGGIDKRELTFGHAEIDAELERVSSMFTQSGYIPALDHLMHPEISLDNFTYFMERLRALIGVE